jgi:hypothetical protein
VALSFRGSRSECDGESRNLLFACGSRNVLGKLCKSLKMRLIPFLT